MCSALKKIIHVDMDSFYASVEMRDNPELRDKPIAVGGPAEKRGVLCTCNYLAREFGVRSAMATGYAQKLCPQLVLVPVNMDKYKAESKKIHAIFGEYTQLIQPLSLDEAYLDVTDTTQCQGSATLIAEEIRRKIFETTDLTASAGIAPNKFLAKISSDLNKPNGQYVIIPDAIEQFMIPLPVEKIFGVGKVAQKRLKELGIDTCGDLQKLTLEELHHKLGNWGANLYNLSRGIGSATVETSRNRKSISQERTFHKDMEGELSVLRPSIEKVYDILSSYISRYQGRQSVPVKMRKSSIKIKFSDFTQTTVERDFGSYSLENFLELMREGLTRKSLDVRLVGLGVKVDSALDQIEHAQIDMFEGSEVAL
ncbi:MAG: DNA polymerase IV [Fibrobacterales bacterium]